MLTREMPQYFIAFIGATILSCLTPFGYRLPLYAIKASPAHFYGDRLSNVVSPRFVSIEGLFMVFMALILVVLFKHVNTDLL